MEHTPTKPLPYTGCGGFCPQLSEATTLGFSSIMPKKFTTMAEYTTMSSKPAKKFAEEQGSKIMVGTTINGTTMFTCGAITGSVSKTLIENGFKGEKLVNEVQKVDEDGVITHFFILTTPFQLNNAKELEL